MEVKFKQWNCKVKYGKYFNKTTAIMLNDIEDGEPVTTPTVCLPEIPLASSLEVLIKDYSENEGITEALIKAGVIESNLQSIEINQYGSKVNKCLLTQEAFLEMLKHR